MLDLFSSCFCPLGCHFLPGILVVESAENGTGDYLGFLLYGLTGRAVSQCTSVSRIGDAGPQAAVRAPGIVGANRFAQQLTEMPLVQRDHEIQTLASYGSDQSFAKCIRLR